MNLKEKYLVTIEFRYSDAPKFEDDCTSRNKVVTIGIYSDFDIACNSGNDLLKKLESQFKLNPHWNKKERFSKNGGCMGTRKTLISNLSYLQTPFTFYAKITTLKCVMPIENAIDDVISAQKRYNQYRKGES